MHVSNLIDLPPQILHKDEGLDLPELAEEQAGQVAVENEQIIEENLQQVMNLDLPGPDAENLSPVKSQSQV